MKWSLPRKLKKDAKKWIELGGPPTRKLRRWAAKVSARLSARERVT